MAKEIKLTQGKVTIVDDEDFVYLNQFKWHTLTDGNRFYALGAIKKSGKWATIRMHREIMQTPKGMETDHRNGDGLDNRKENLRICSCSQNQMNRGKQNNNTSGYKGVYYHKKTGQWQASIKINPTLKHLGLYVNKEEAAEAYNEAAKEYFGEFARLNIIK